MQIGGEEMDVLEVTGSAYGLGCPFPQNGQNERPVADIPWRRYKRILTSTIASA